MHSICKIISKLGLYKGKIMAGPVAHIVCALALLNSGALKIEDKQAFLVGTSFPDIRYLGVIKREQTHKHDVTWQDIQNESDSFKAGMLLHSLVDRIREEYMMEHNVYNLVPKFPFFSQSLKLYEDMLIYNSMDEWQLISSYFNEILSSERAFGIKEQDIKRWHQILQTFFVKRPTPQLITQQIKQHMLVQHFYGMGKYIPDYPIIKYVDGMIKSMENSKKLQKIITDFYDNIVDFLIHK